MNRWAAGRFDGGLWMEAVVRLPGWTCTKTRDCCTSPLLACAKAGVGRAVGFMLAPPQAGFLAMLAMGSCCGTHCTFVPNVPFKQPQQVRSGSVLRTPTPCLRFLYGRLPCGKQVFEVLTRRVHCGLISGLFVQCGLASAAGPDGHSRGWSSSRLRALPEGLPEKRNSFTNPRSDRFAITSFAIPAHSGVALLAS